MKKNNKKQVYSTPAIVSVELDNDISLQLSSVPPIGPGETSLSPEFLRADPFKVDLG